ncbi:preprotein translocase subunit SecG [Aurantiacibacter poecillastricola]|uniref:preprotein translocase subunit SecG n=1 Tax=Aurantiacibacter poecillastricola TaxID=3064385 RepID=UPI0027400366|nr:preprotein translocase subunit SecG [Aurantiacibacter sp. 219JJ12-13]MDP5262091.1 preprotein translocase subunit SecG [Aurantiacibacter sp. 219JJ12-13]
MFIFLTVIQAFIAAGLVILVLMQRSEGGGLGIGSGGSPGGLMSARGAADFLTRATKWFAILFVALSIVLAAVAVDATGSRDFDETLDRTTAPASNDDLIPGDPGLDGEPPVDPIPDSDDPLADIAE